MRARRVLIGVAVVALAAAFVSARWRWQSLVQSQTPALTDAPDGPLPSTTRIFGVEVGRSRPADVEALAASAGLVCQDRSMGALVRDGVASAAAQKKAAGENAWLLEGYGWLNPHGRNPQVRLACEHVDSARLTDRQRLPFEGYLLFVFDGPDQPLRHASLSRTYADATVAEADWYNSSLALAATFDPQGPLPTAKSLRLMRPVSTAFAFATLSARVDGLNRGSRTTVTEVVEVPWPIKASAAAMTAKTGP